MTTAKTIYLKDYTVPDYLISDVYLEFNLDATKTQVVSRLTLEKNPQSNNKNSALVLNGEKLELISVALNGQILTNADYELTPETLTLFNLPQNEPFLIEICNVINPKENTALEGLYLSNRMLCTQCEAEGFRKITYFIDRPDVMARFTVKLTADKNDYPVLLSNGNKQEAGYLENNRHFVIWQDPFAKPCYLFALVGGKLDCVEDKFITMSGRNIDLQIFVETHDVNKCSHAMESLKRAMRWDEKVYGREYDLDLYMIVAVGHFNMGAMENKGLNIFNTKYVLARPDTATDFDYEHIEGVIAHEYFHNWSGNRVTCRDWFQLSLKEGFTVFRDQQFTSDMTSHAVKRIDDVIQLRTRQFAEDASPLAHSIRPDSYIEINNFYTLTVYEKGAEIVRMLHTLLGVENFRKGTDLYFSRHDGQAATCEDFVKALEDANQVDLSQFRRWYSQVGTPTIKVEENYDTETKTFSFTLSQHYSNQSQPLLIPVRLLLLNSQTGENLTSEMLFQFNQMQWTFTFENLDLKPVISILRDFSAPVKLEMKRDLEELAFLSRHDSDSFNRWEAGQQLANQLILKLIDDIQHQRALVLNPILLDTFEAILNQPPQDLSYFALLLSLPSETYLAEQMAIIDVDAIYLAREFVLNTLANRFQDKFLTLYQQHHQTHSDLSATSIGKRRIKNLCLAYLSRLPNYQRIALNQFEQSQTMTDKISALTVMVNFEHLAKEECLEKFYVQWKNEALVIDKWFTIQATSSADKMFESVQHLLNHHAFDIKNPNRVRSLIGAFSQSNPRHFHASNGQGYQFLADKIIELNVLNPQVASRMTSALTSWRRYDENRQMLMKTELERILKTNGISNDVYEMISKSLA